MRLLFMTLVIATPLCDAFVARNLSKDLVLKGSRGASQTYVPRESGSTCRNMVRIRDLLEGDSEARAEGERLLKQTESAG